MPQFFQSDINRKTRWVLAALPVGVAIVLGATMWAGSADFITGRGRSIEQPVPFPHDIHSGKLKLDCRYCHESVERSSFAGMPSAEVCLNCHSQVWTGLAALEPIRSAQKSDLPLAWRRIHDVPDYARFDHSIHVAKGVGCVACHGRVDQMAEVQQTESLLMTWCLDCHRDPIPHLQPRETVFDLAFQFPSGVDALNELAREVGVRGPISKPRDLQQALATQYHVRQKTSCSSCHQ